ERRLPIPSLNKSTHGGGTRAGRPGAHVHRLGHLARSHPMSPDPASARTRTKTDSARLVASRESRTAVPDRQVRAWHINRGGQALANPIAPAQVMFLLEIGAFYLPPLRRGGGGRCRGGRYTPPRPPLRKGGSE